MQLRELVEHALDAACTAYLPAPRATSEVGESLTYATMLGFAGDQLRGTLALTAGTGGLAHVCSQLGASPEHAADALGELGNLIAAHIKRTIGRYGPLVTLTPPIVMRGVQVEVCGGIDGERGQHEVRVGPARVVAWLDCEANGDLVLDESAAVDTLSEGESLLF